MTPVESSERHCVGGGVVGAGTVTLAAETYLRVYLLTLTACPITY
jgi:hypothetical protein